jgi:quercetin dioxygenase-like cupin family protein
VRFTGVANAAALRDTWFMAESSATALQHFRARALDSGADEVLERRWAPNQIVEMHSHPFDADALVTEGEMWLTCGGETRHLCAGDTFFVSSGAPHSERYGPQGAIYWVARRTKPR